MTIKEIAKLAGVSISTVSKILNNKDDSISLETRNHVLKIAKEYHYVPYASIKTASTAKTFMLGVLVRQYPDHTLFLKGLISAAQTGGYSAVICDSQNSPEEELKNITSLCRDHVDGVIWEPVSEQSAEFQHYFEELDIPICFVNSTFPESYGIDFQEAGYQAAKQLISYKHQKIACLTDKGKRNSDAFFSGFKKCLFDAHIPYDSSMDLSIHEKDQCGQILLHGLTGIVSFDFASSLALCGELHALQYQLPYDISLISLREDAGEQTEYFKISTIRLPFYEFGAHVCRQMIAKCEKELESYREFVTDYPVESCDSLDVPFTEKYQKIVVVGSINIDVTLNVDELPQSGKTISTNKYTIFPGGKGANQAIGASRLGHKVALIGKVGNDFDATMVYSLMEENHVDTRGIIRDNRMNTGKAYIHVQNDGESIITILAGANDAITPENIETHSYLFKNTGYCLLQTEIPIPVVQRAALLARSCGAKTILKPTAADSLPDSMFEAVDIFVPNKAEAAILCPQKTTLSDQADYFLSKGVGTVIITLGHHGCYVKTGGYEETIPAVPFIPVDNTGAADAFISALASYLLYGYELSKAIKIAAYAAGFCISRQGVVPALIDQNTLESYIKKTDAELLK